MTVQPAARGRARPSSAGVAPPSTVEEERALIVRPGAGVNVQFVAAGQRERLAPGAAAKVRSSPSSEKSRRLLWPGR